MRWLINLMITSLIFFPEKNFYDRPENYGLISEDVQFAASDGTQLHGWFLKAPENRGTVLYFHGNAGNISGRLQKAQGWIRRGYAVFLIDYRGYGKSEGTIKNQSDVISDAQGALTWLRSEKENALEKIIFYGESLGSHPAVRLACEHNAKALILEAPFTSFIDLGKIHYPLAPSFLIRDFAFANIDFIENIKTPVFILHGTADEIVPYEMGQKLFGKARTQKKMLTIEGAAHNNLPQQAGEDYWNKPAAFIASL